MKRELGYRFRYSNFLFFSIFLALFMNIGNYSFFTYTLTGRLIGGPLPKLIAYSRLPLLFGAVLILLVVNKQLKKSIFSFIMKQLDIVIMLLLLVVSLSNALDKVNGALYTVWHMISYFAGLTFIYFTFTKNKNEYAAFYDVVKVLFLGNLIVVPLLVINIGTYFQESGLKMAFGSKSFYAFCLCLLICSALVILLLKRYNLVKKDYLLRIPSIFYFLFVFLCIFLISGSGRRTPLLVSLVSLFVFLYYYLGKTQVTRLFFGFFLLIGLAAFIYSIPTIIENYGESSRSLERLGRINLGGEEAFGDSSYLERLIIWNSYAKILADFPFFGVGLFNGTIHHIARYGDWYLVGYSTHNTYFAILVETGFVGFGMFLTIIVRSVILLFRKAQQLTKVFYIIFFIPILIVCWTEFNSLAGQVFFWAILLVILFPRGFVIKNRYKLS